MFNPKISIIIPVYNGENYLEEAIKSALNQNYNNIEIIVVDDGSVDGTRTIAERYLDRIRYKYKTNGGVASALNCGISEMTGDYFMWLSHDDFFYGDKVSSQVKAALEDPENRKFLYSNYDLLDMNCNTVYHCFSPYTKYGDYTNKGVFPVLYGLINGCTVMVHRSLFDEVGVFDPKLKTAQDYDMWFRMLRTHEPYYVDKRLVCNRMHGEQGSKTIAEFVDNCQEQHKKMINSLTCEEYKDILGGEYKVLSDMILLSEVSGWKGLRDELLSKICKMDQSLTKIEKKEIYLYGAGRNCKSILKESLYKGVCVKGICDKNKDLWGKEIEGIQCISIDSADPSYEIWITIENDEGIKTDLEKRGFISKSNKEVYEELFKMLPDINAIKENINKI